MDSRKYQLKQKIIEALKAKDNDLYALLKSQWAHRFGVESLEELQNLDLTDLALIDQNTINKNNQKNDQSDDSSFDVDKEISIKDDNNKKNEIKNESKKVLNVTKVEAKDSFEIKSDEIVDSENNKNNPLNQISEYKSLLKVEALIPLPPKPKYGYLRKWLLKSLH